MSMQGHLKMYNEMGENLEPNEYTCINSDAVYYKLYNSGEPVVINAFNFFLNDTKRE